ncbi:hypothetical protein L916_19079 [Phytophthora nicotianae]|uniref:BZIP domain-containing protein n=1 Tax=Phytophthora nicotianae TaxID=4792 RepID=W2I1W5_PHYNI|nr:hypothetical protein L916_19079 [Phytophthora nicotianae]
MSSSVFYPPNIHRFGDDVIGKVIQRVNPPSYIRPALDSRSECIVSSLKFTSETLPCPESFRSTSTATTPDVPKRTCRNAVQLSTTALSTDRKDDLSSKKSPTLDTTSLSKKRRATISTKKDRTVDIELIRSRRRANMQRYRNKLRKHAVTVEENVEHLREEIKELELEHHTTLAGIKKHTSWSIAAEYFRLFRYGLRGDFAPSKPLESMGYASSSGSTAQRGFLCANMAADVVGPTGCGVQNLIDDLRKLTLCLPTLETRVVRLKTGPRKSITAVTRVEITMTANTIRLAFPHLVQNEKWSPFALMLLDQQFVMDGSVHLEWDSDSSRVALLQSKSDLLTPMLKVFGNLDIVTCIFENAFITPECTLARRDT